MLMIFGWVEHEVIVVKQMDIEAISNVDTSCNDIEYMLVL